MPLFLRKVDHPQARDSYRVVYDDVEIGSIGLQWASTERVWTWGIDTVLPPDRQITTDGHGESREDCMVQFKAAWHKFSRNPERLEKFMDIKRDLQKKWRNPT